MATTGEKIKLLREDLKISVEDFSSKLGIEANVLLDWENGKVEPTEDDVKKVVALVTELRNANNKEEKLEEASEEKPVENKEDKPEQKVETVDVTDKRGAKIGNCSMCNKEIHKYDKYSQYRNKKQDVFICDECDQKRKQDPKFKRLSHLVNWLTYSSYLYIGIALCTIIIFFAEGQKLSSLTIVTGVFGAIAVIQIISALVVSKIKNI